jgi:hypothetical protein
MSPHVFGWCIGLTFARVILCCFNGALLNRNIFLEKSMKPARILVDADEFPPLRSTMSHEQHQNPIGVAFLRKQMHGSGRAPVGRICSLIHLRAKQPRPTCIKQWKLLEMNF